jgi:hypothetical protein
MNITATSLADWLIANPLLGFLLIVWTFAWKGLALWKAAGLHQKKWFIAMLILNTAGILEIIYLYFVARKYKVEVVEK